MEEVQVNTQSYLHSNHGSKTEGKRIALSANCSENSAFFKEKKIRSESMSLSLKKNIIRINKNKFPSDFFSSRKPEIVSASLPKRPIRQIDTSPLKYKLSMKQIETNAYSGYQKTEEEDADEDLLRMTSCFGNALPKDNQSDKNSEEQKNYYSQQIGRNKSNNRIPQRQGSKQSKHSKTGRKAPFFGNIKIAKPKTKVLHLPQLNISPLRKQIEKSRKLSQDTNNANDLQFRKKIRALINNSNTAPKTKLLSHLNSDSPKYDRLESDATQDLCQSQILTITFCKNQKNRFRS